MDLKSIAMLIPVLLSAYDSISALIAGAKSNEDVVTKITNLSPRIADFLKWLGGNLFPSVNPQLQDAAAAVTIFGREFVKAAQMTLNIASPLMGIASPNLVVDGINGPMTQAATKQVQETLKTKGIKVLGEELVADGFYGFKTRDAVNAFLASVSK